MRTGSTFASSQSAGAGNAAAVAKLGYVVQATSVTGMVLERAVSWWKGYVSSSAGEKTEMKEIGGSGDGGLG